MTDRTWRDLGLDAVFAKLDRSASMLGRQTLYRRLRRASDTPAEAARFDRKVRAFASDEPLRAGFREAVAPLDDDRSAALAPLLWGEAPALPRAAMFFPFATCATFLAAAVSVVWPIALLVFIGLVIGNIAIRLHLHNVMSVHADALTTIAKLVNVAENAGSLESAELRVDLETLRAAVAAVAPWRRSLAWATLDSRSLNEVAATIVAYLNCFFLLDVNAYVSSLALLRQGTPPLRLLFETIGELDAARSTASFRAGTKTWATPAIGRRGSPIVLTAMVHPLVEAGVPNDVVLTHTRGSALSPPEPPKTKGDPGPQPPRARSAPEGWGSGVSGAEPLTMKGWLVLGSNMSGKSTLLRAIALQAILAQSIATTTCEGYAAPPLLVRTLIYVEDDLLREKSHFYVEAESVRDMLVEEADDVDRLCIVDELFRGTNTQDRVAAGAAVLRGLHRRGVFVVAATHDAELLDLLAAELDPHFFTEQVTGGRIVFDYKLRAGRAAPRNALAVLALVGCPEDVLADARVGCASVA